MLFPGDSKTQTVLYTIKTQTCSPPASHPAHYQTTDVQYRPNSQPVHVEQNGDTVTCSMLLVVRKLCSVVLQLVFLLVLSLSFHVPDHALHVQHGLKDRRSARDYLQMAKMNLENMTFGVHIFLASSFHLKCLEEVTPYLQQ